MCYRMPTEKQIAIEESLWKRSGFEGMRHAYNNFCLTDFPKLFVIKQLILYLHHRWFPEKELKGNAVRIGNSSRCCKLLKRF